jgi:hypothetical protein
MVSEASKSRAQLTNSCKVTPSNTRLSSGFKVCYKIQGRSFNGLHTKTHHRLNDSPFANFSNQFGSLFYFCNGTSETVGNAI